MKKTKKNPTIFVVGQIKTISMDTNPRSNGVDFFPFLIVPLQLC